MSGRTYLSIGDVLSLLREEFPDVTISKIRFLESQGLVNPERSPSGYRKFYEHDVERLRWVLRQQRERFLPLKVIRDRLAREGDTAVPADIEADVEEEPVHVTVGVPGRVQGNGVPLRAEEPALALSGGGHLASAVGRDAAIGGRVPSSSPPPQAPAPRAEAVSRPAPSSPTPTAPTPTAPTTATPTTAAPVPSAQPRVGRAPAPAPPTAQVPTAQVPTAQVPTSPLPAARVPASPVPTTATPADGLSAAVSGASLTAEELCGATGLSATDVASLEGFGLIEPMAVAGVLYYDEEALTVAKLVAEFAHYGIEPRHLRLYRNAVDREMGLVEQIVTPLLRQRNPEARQRAVDAAADLAKLGQGLRGSLLRREIRRQLGG